MILLVACFITTANAQERITVRGTVTGQNGESLAGAFVAPSNPAQGVVTNETGNFTLSAAPGETLTFSYVGYHNLTEAARPEMNVRMQEDMVAMDAVTVVGIGYGTMRKSDLTGSISSVSATDMKQGVITSAEQLLQGKIAGLTVSQATGDPTQGANMRLRGGTSLSASNSPLIVVDGIPGVDMNTIQPGDISSIDVLKDASAAAIYGSRGANGVIIVTTKRGTESFSMNYNGYFAVGAVAKNLDLLSANQWREYVRENNIAGAMDYGADTDWQKELERTAITHSHNLSFSHGGKQGGVRASLSYLDTEGVIKTSYLNRLAGSVTGYQYGLKNRLRLEASVNATKDTYHPVDIRIWERAYNLNPTLPVKQNGEYTQIGGTNANNPVEMLYNRKDDQTRLRLLGFAKAELEIVEGLKGVANVSYEYNSWQQRFYTPSYAFFDAGNKGYGRRSLGDYTNTQLEAYLTYDKTFNDIHKLNVMAGYSYLKNMYEGFAAERRGFDTDVFSYNNLSAGNTLGLGDASSYKGTAKLISFFGRINYVLMDRYMITATLRRDGSSRFGANHKWGTFPSVSAAWRISEENFMKTAWWVDNLKLRVGYGVTGNQDGIDSYRSLSLMGITSGGAYYDQATDSWKQSYGITQNANPDLKWESTAQANIGVDFAFLGRFSVTIDAYLKKTSDLLYTYPVPQPPYLYHEMMANVGDLENKGIEFTLGADIVRKKNFTFSANATLAYNVQKVTKLSNDIYQTEAIAYGNLHGLQGMTGVYTQTLREGYAVGTFWGPRCLGIDEDGKYILNRDSKGELIYENLGNAQPKLTLGLSLDLTYRDFDLNISGYGLFGQKVLNAQGMTVNSIGRLPGANVPDAWLDKGISDGAVFSDYWIEKGDFFRMQNITLGYSVPLKDKWFSKIRVYATVENLFVLTGYSGIDPEINYSGLLSPGIDKSIGDSVYGDNYYYPRPRTFIFGVNLSF
uniref:Putative TonB-dependent receptor family protein n=1 Tax=termite gut metagenome TaxID=433724 RepID=S0DFY5_9ZZZZ